MRMIRLLRLTVVGLPLVICLSSSPVQAQRFWSPPGWFGPGPAQGRYTDPGPGPGWQYFNLQNGPTVVGGGVGMGWGPQRNWGPLWWGIPGAAGSFWTNGKSLYGPPVPTYAPTPGVFGAYDNDRLFFRNPPPTNSVFFGLGWGGYRSPSPRGIPLSVSVYPQPAHGVQLLAGPPATAPDGQLCIRLTVRLPEPTADLWVDKTEMKQKGMERIFESPPLTGNAEYTYTLVARWNEDGRDRAESRQIIARPGETISVDFTASNETATTARQ